MDLDLSNEISANEVYAYFQAENYEKSGTAGQRVMYHPFESYDQGKRIQNPAYLADEADVVQFVMKIVNQKICVYWGAFNDTAVALSVIGTIEYADI